MPKTNNVTDGLLRLGLNDLQIGAIEDFGKKATVIGVDAAYNEYGKNFFYHFLKKESIPVLCTVLRPLLARTSASATEEANLDKAYINIRKEFLETLAATLEAAQRDSKAPQDRLM